MVAQSDWLPLMMAMGGCAMSWLRLRGLQVFSRNSEAAPCRHGRSLEGARFALDNVGGELILEPDDLILEGKLALLEALDLKLIAGDHALQGVDGHVEVAVFLLQTGQFRFKFSQFGH